MRTFLLPTVILAAALVIAASSFADDDEDKSAWKLGDRTNDVRFLQVETMESAPPQFAVKLEVAMPEPGWKLEVDSVGEPDAHGRIVVKLTGERPDGMLPQVITMTPVRVSLGSLDVGDYLIDVFLKKDDRPYARAGTVMLRATK